MLGGRSMFRVRDGFHAVSPPSPVITNLAFKEGSKYKGGRATSHAIRILSHHIPSCDLYYHQGSPLAQRPVVDVIVLKLVEHQMPAEV